MAVTCHRGTRANGDNGGRGIVKQLHPVKCCLGGFPAASDCARSRAGKFAGSHPFVGVRNQHLSVVDVRKGAVVLPKYLGGIRMLGIQSSASIIALPIEFVQNALGLREQPETFLIIETSIRQATGQHRCRILCRDLSQSPVNVF